MVVESIAIFTGYVTVVSNIKLSIIDMLFKQLFFYQLVSAVRFHMAVLPS